MMELADMRDLGSRAERRRGSSPLIRTTHDNANTVIPIGDGFGFVIYIDEVQVFYERNKD